MKKKPEIFNSYFCAYYPSSHFLGFLRIVDFKGRRTDIPDGS